MKAGEWVRWGWCRFWTLEPGPIPTRNPHVPLKPTDSVLRHSCGLVSLVGPLQNRVRSWWLFEGWGAWEFAAIFAEGGGLVAAEAAEAGFGEIETFGGEMGDDPATAEGTAADGTHLKDAAGEFLFDHPRGEDSDAEIEEDHFLDGGNTGDLHGGEGFHAMILEEAADQLTAGAGSFVEDESLGLDIGFAERLEFCPWMMA